MMKKQFIDIESRGLPGGPNEVFSYITGVFSIDGYKSDSPDVNNPFNIIPSSNITMEGVDFPVRGYGNNGIVQDMKPGGNYNYGDADYVFEVPMAQDGVELNKKYIDSTFNANMDKRWVQRLYEKNPEFYLEGQTDPSTHFMESGDSMVYPLVIEGDDGNLMLDRQKGRSQGIKFPTDEIAQWFAKNYKDGTDVLKEKQRGGGLLNKTMKCNSCGWKWKAADGGNDVSSCHKCGGEALPTAQGGREQATISQYEEPAWYEKAVDYLASPMTAFGYSARNQDLPDSIPINAENRNAFDGVIDTINPFAWAKYAASAKRNADQGEYLDAGFDALGAIPIVPAWLSRGKNAAKNLPLEKLDDLVEVVTANGSVKKIPRKDAIRLSRVEDANVTNTSFSKYEDGNWFADKPSEFYVNRTKNAMSPVSYDMLEPGDPRRLITMYMDPSDAKNFSVVKGSPTERALNMSGGMGNMPHPQEYVIPPALVKQIRETGKIPGGSTFIGNADDVMKNLSDFYKKYGGDIGELDQAQLGAFLKSLKPAIKKGAKYIDSKLSEWLQLSGENVIKKAASSVDDAGKGFKSEINWAKWNKEIPDNASLMREYNTIEKVGKAKGTWMKNPDGSKFTGTPEQWVQQQSSNYKAAFGETKLLNPDGSPMVLYHGSPKKFDAFDESMFQLGDSGFSGSGIYTTPSKVTAESYTISGRRFHDGKIEPTLYELYGRGNNPITSKQLIDNSGGDIGFAKVGEVIDKNLPTSLFNFHRKGAPKIDQLLDYDVAIHNQRRGITNIKPINESWEIVFPTNKQLKSSIGNNGMFDMTNPNIYKQSGGEYQVKKGDTFYGIANRNNISWDKLKEANPNLNIDKLSLGQKLIVPGYKSPEPVVENKPKKEFNPYKDIDSTSQERRFELDKALKKVASLEPENKNLYGNLLMVAAMENSYGANPDSYKRTYTRGPMSIDDIAYKDLFEPRGENNKYLSSQKNWFNYLSDLGFDYTKMDKTLRSNDPLAGVAAARIQYGRTPEALPDVNNPEAMYNYYMKYYNRTKADHKERFMGWYNELLKDKEYGGDPSYNVYKKFMAGGFISKDEEKEAEKVYDKLNRIHYSDAKSLGMSPANYIMTHIIRNS